MDTQKTPLARAKAHIARQHYQTIATSGNHSIVIDEPEDLKGTDTGISPFGLLLSSLGSCTVITLRMYIDHKMWVVDEITAQMEVYAVEDGHQIETTLHFKGELTSEQIKRLTEIADACPIHKLLAGNIALSTKIA